MKSKIIILAMVLLVALASTSFAVPVYNTAVTQTTTLVTDLTAMSWTFVLSIVGALVGIKLFKKFFGRSTS